MVRVVKTKVEVEGHVHEETVIVERDEPASWEDGKEFAVVGKSIHRVDGRERVTGSARYTSDIQPSGLLFAAVLRSPHAHARITLIDTSEAAKLPGVRAVLSSTTGPDIAWYGGASKLFDTTLRFAGEEVAAIAADDEETARNALKAIRVEYELLPAVTRLGEALAPGAPEIHPKGIMLDRDNYSRGDVDAAFAEAEVTVTATYTTPTALHNSFETHGAVASWDGDNLTIWESTQYIFGVRSRVADALGVPLSNVRVICDYMGGGFGSKGQVLKHSVIAALLAKAGRRPVKLMLTRNEENLLTGNRGETVQHVRLAATRDGKLTGIEMDAAYAVGAYGTWAGSVTGPAKELYLCPNVRTSLVGVRTNLGSHAAFRAPGFVEGTFGLECAIDELCSKLGMDRAEFRSKNHSERDQVDDHDYTGKHLLECYSEALRLAERGSVEKLGTLRSSGPGPWRRGTGMASQVWSGGGGPPAHALVRFNADGSAEVMCGTQDIGTGVKTALSQIAAEELGMSIEAISFRLGDTQRGPFAPASWGSMTVPSVGPAVRAAAEDARQQLLEIASHYFETPAQTLQVKNGRITVEGRAEGSRAIKDILSEIGDYMITGKGFRGPNPSQPLRTWGAQIADVAVNIETGQVRVERIIAVHDVGRVLNPQGLASQFYGGILQGLGFAVSECRVVDDASGTVLNPNLQDYKIPTIADAPQMIVRGLDKADTAANHVGSKGAGEPPIIPTPAAIANAIFDACGVRVRNLPATPATMLALLNQIEQVEMSNLEQL